MNVWEALIFGGILMMALCWIVPGFSALLVLFIIFCIVI